MIKRFLEKVHNLSSNSKQFILSTIFAVFTVLILVFALLAMSNAEGLYLFLTFLFLAISRLFCSLTSKYFKETNIKIYFYKNLGFFLAYLVCGILCFAISDKVILMFTIGALYLATIASNRVCIFFEVKNKFHKFVEILLIGLIVFAIVTLFDYGSSKEEVVATIYAALLFVIIMVSLLDVLAFAFSKIQLGHLLKIIRKTYTIEILFGMIILVVACSFYFSMMEENIKTFGDGIWFSFSLITTIGLGDITVLAPFSRFLAIILGLYGLIFVASITSVIVNFYNEVKHDEPDEVEEKKDEDKKE